MGVIVDYQILYNLAVGAAMFLGGWVLNSITSDLRQITADVKGLSESHSRTREEYVLKVDHKADLADLTHRFDNVDTKLDRIVELVYSGKAHGQ